MSGVAGLSAVLLTRLDLNWSIRHCSLELKCSLVQSTCSHAQCFACLYQGATFLMTCSTLNICLARQTQVRKMSDPPVDERDREQMQ